MGITVLLRAPTGVLLLFLVLSTATLDEFQISIVGASRWRSGGLGGSLLVHRRLYQYMLLGSVVCPMVLVLLEVAVRNVGRVWWVMRHMLSSIARPPSELGRLILLPFVFALV